MTTDNHWIGKPGFKPYFLRSIIIFMHSIGFICIIYGVFLIISIFANLPMPKTWLLLISVFIFGQGFYSLIKRLYEFKYLRYEITYNDLVIRRGKNDRSIKIINLDNIKFIESKLCFNDKFFGTRTIKLFVGEIDKSNDEIEQKFDELESIENVDNILHMIRKER